MSILHIVYCFDLNLVYGDGHVFIRGDVIIIKEWYDL